MKPHFVTALAIALAASQFAATAATAKEPVASFRSAAPESFSTRDLQRYGLSADAAKSVADQQAQGKQVVVLTPEEASKYHAGAYPGLWWIVGGVVLVVAIVAIADN